MTDTSTRKLAAIMFTDMVGYTALMQQDEQQAKSNRDHHRTVLNRSVNDNHGTILQYYGDGTLSIFNSALDAINCAIHVQSILNVSPKIPLRIGIHVGDIVHDEEGIYGSGVNIASRVESMGVPGSVLISDRVNDELKNHPQYKTTLLGSYKLKNVDLPVDLYAIVDERCVVPRPDQLQGKGEIAQKSIAVLPFVNISNDPENEYFSDGITEEILNVLTKIKGLQVTSRTSSFAFKNISTDLREIAEKLSVNTILEGSVRRAGSRVRVTAQLINAMDGYHLWSETFDRQIEDIFEVQDEISRKIANQLRIKLTTEEKHENLVKAPTTNLEAYNLYLKGSFYVNKWNPDGAKKGIKYFEQAIELEEKFALPYSGLAYCYTMLGAMGQLPPSAVFPKGREMALKALQLDDGLAESHMAIALIHLFYDLDMKKAQKSMARAIELNPGSAHIHHIYSFYYYFVNQFDEALSYINKALELDPLSLIINQHLGELYAMRGENEKAIQQLNKTLELDPYFRPAIENKGWVYINMGNYEKAIEIFLHLHKLIAHPLKGITGLGYAYAISGQKERAREILAKFAQREKEEPQVMLQMDYVTVYTGLKDFDKVFEHLDAALEEHVGIFFIKTAFIFKDVRRDPRYKQVLKKHSIQY
jgi:TolB-like protein/class 3 adenylate cyclase/Tfp pilus assembly protein PilF